MDEKGSQVIRSQAGLRRGIWSPLRFFTIGALIYYVIFQAAWQSAWKAKPNRQTVDGRLKYPGEKITWEVCGDLEGRKFECSEIDVPMDQFSPANSGNNTFRIPLIRLRGANATQNLILNPGGPGASGFELLSRRGKQLSSIVGEGFHLLSFDPRGVNGSRPQALCYPNDEARRSLSEVRSMKVVEDSAEVYAWTRNFVQSCRDTTGVYGNYLNTPQTAADMNNILDAVGQEDMVYWGLSYGTILGQTYATLFPERSKRIIIDGVANNFDHYENPIDLEQFADLNNVLEGFFDECIKAGENCTLSSLAKTKEELQDKVLAFIETLEEPLSVYIDNTAWGVLNRESVILNGLFLSLYSPANWYILSERLTKLMQGNATEAFLAWGLSKAWDGVLSLDATVFISNNDGVVGPDYYPQGRQEFLEFIKPSTNISLFGFLTAPALYTKQQWSVPRTHNFVQKASVKTAHPLLILSNTYDPVCPLISARSAHAIFEGSQIVELKGYGHCSTAMPSNCVAKHVRAYLYNGTLPANHTQCEVDGPYFNAPDSNGSFISALKHFEDPEDQLIHRAQLEIARDNGWWHTL